MQGGTPSTAVRRTSVRISRRRLFALSGGAAGAATLLSACGESDAPAETARFGDGDLAAVNFLLTLEHLEAAFYGAIVEASLFTGRERAIMRQFHQQETEHVGRLAELAGKLEGEASAPPQARFPLEGAGPALSLAAELENVVAAAYLGQLPNVAGKASLATLLSIHTVEGEHAATMAELRGAPITPDGSRAKPLNAREALRFVDRFMVG